MGKIYQFLFIYFIRKTPEKWGKAPQLFCEEIYKIRGEEY